MIQNPTAQANVLTRLQAARQLGSRDGGAVRHDPHRYSIFEPGTGFEMQAHASTGMVYFYQPEIGGSTLAHEERNTVLAQWVISESNKITGHK